jgi:hypothetical protein
MPATKWFILAATFALILSAAKTHGRQIRLERERAGYLTVVFGGDNPPWVETLWRRDRILFWGAFAAAVSLALAYAFSAARFGLPLPIPPKGGASGMPPWGSLLLFAGAWPFAFAFLAAGFASLLRLASALSKTAAASAPADIASLPAAVWTRNAWLGSAAWWTLTLALAAAISIAACRRSA